MSADNYYMVRKHPRGGYVAVMGFMSDPSYPEVREDREYVIFDSPIDALLWAQTKPTEYGASVHPECEVRKLSKSDDA